ncbi:stearoyl-CoA desaturase 5 [Galendromus occidentalis]|uniref:Stearoyl-CoA desaturase 5 n=1 Tax=Galendromus occidentalis TaxID=34638 RepID=A0AAJ6QRJ5_9ACAR|nr:stearoyl-CoA desaturase 5 [Galendromus occidentalis]
MSITQTVTTATTSQVVPFRVQIVWRNVILMAYLHIAALYGLYLMFTSAKLSTSITALVLYVASGLGITAGAHRLWSHKAYKAKLPLRVFLAAMQSMALQNSIFEWCRDHRVHHKFSETDADPHNANRGFFFAHVGWLLCKKHPDVATKGKKVDMSDLLKDPVVVFQKNHYKTIALMSCFVIPTLIPIIFFGENFVNAFFVCGLFRYCWTLNMTWFVNSAAHMWGNHPYDHHIHPAENWAVSLVANGEGWHNYHHTFPYDYKAAEVPYTLNISTFFIDFMKSIGQAYDCRAVPKETILARMMRTGCLATSDQHYKPEEEKDF